MPLVEDVLRGPISTSDVDPNLLARDVRRKIHEIRMRAAPFVAMIEGNPSQKTHSVRYEWAQQPYSSGRGTVTDVFTDAGLLFPYAAGGVVGTPLYIQATAADASKVIATDVITIYSPSTGVYINLYVVAVVIAGANSYLACVLQQIDTGSDLANTDLVFTVTGNAQAPYAGLPTPIYSQPVLWNNQVETFSAAFELDNRQLKHAEMVDPDLRIRAREQSLVRMKRNKQLAYIFGIDTTETALGTKPITFTGGYLNALRTHEPNNIFNFKTDVNFVTPGATFLDEGLLFLEDIAEFLARKGESPRKKVYTSSLVMKMINRAVRNVTAYTLTTGANEWGLNIAELNLGAQVWDLVEDPVFTEDPMLQLVMLPVEPKLLCERTYLGGDLKFIPDTDNEGGGKNYRSGIKEGWEETKGFQYDNLEAQGFITVSNKNTVAP